MKVSELVEQLLAVRQDAPVIIDSPGDGIWNSFAVEEVTDEFGLDTVVIFLQEMPEPDDADMYGRK